MEANYENAIANAAKKLNELHFICCSIVIGYDDIKTGFILGIATSFNMTPQQVEIDIENYTE